MYIYINCCGAQDAAQWIDGDASCAGEEVANGPLTNLPLDGVESAFCCFMKSAKKGGKKLAFRDFEDSAFFILNTQQKVEVAL